MVPLYDASYRYRCYLFSPATLGANCHFKTIVAGAEWIGLGRKSGGEGGKGRGRDCRE